MTSLGSLIAVAVKSYASKQILNFIGKNSWKKIFPPLTWEYFLRKVILQTIADYEKKYPYKIGYGENFPFYASQILFEKLTSYVLFNKGSIESLPEDFEINPKIQIPTREELSEFYELFYKNIKDSKLLRDAFVNENYKEQVYLISDNLENLSEKLDTVLTKLDGIEAILINGKITTQFVINSLNNQVTNQLKNQTNSGKYLKDTFIEMGNQKDFLRYMCDSVFFSQKLYNEINVKDFRYINDLLIKKDLPIIDLNIKQFTQEYPIHSLGTSKDVFCALKLLLSNKITQINESGLTSSQRFTWEIKLKDLIEDINFFISKITIITETAGQGKTNFLCDFTENFLCKRQIPVVFLTGIELNSFDIRTSILNRIFPERKNIEFINLLSILQPYCYKEKKFFIIIIDGINESLNSQALSKSIESFINDMLEFDFVKIVLSCRTEYFEDNFKNLESANFKNDLNFISSLVNTKDSYVTNKLFDNYFEYFNINYKVVNADVKKQLTNNFLLLRIFCEAFEGQVLGNIDNIYKEELFENYYVRKSSEINNRLITPESGLKGKFEIKNFINKILELMISNKTYSNISIDLIIEDPSKAELLQRFLDENLLIKRDLEMSVDVQIFSSSEVVNFTFDEFRDFLISRYLIEVIYKRSVEEFKTFLIDSMDQLSPIVEGCSTFLFYKSRKSVDLNLKSIIQEQDWYTDVFSKCIFNVRDEQVTDEDKETLKNIFVQGSIQNSLIVRRLLNRRDPSEYKNLNLDFLIDIILDFDEDSFNKNFTSIFGLKYERFNKIDQSGIVDFLEPKLSELNDTSISLQKFFEFLIYMMTNKDSWIIKDLYERFHFKFPEIGNIQLKRALETKNEKLKISIIKFSEGYGISL